MQQDATRDSTPTPRSIKRRILIVEDDPDLWALLQRFSKRLDPGMDVAFSENAPAAIERLSADERFDAIVSDFCMPKPGDGYSLRARVKAIQPWARFGMISSMIGFRPKDVPYLAKPFTARQYRNFLRELMA